VSLGLWQDRPAAEVVRTAEVADAPGYGEMFAEAGFGDVVRFARTRPHPGELLAAIPPEIVGHVSLAGEAQAVRARLAEYANAGVDEIALVPGSSEADPAGVATLTALAP